MADEERIPLGALTDAQIGEFWDYDISAEWVREKLAGRIRAAGYVVVPSNSLAQLLERLRTAEAEVEGLASEGIEESQGAEKVYDRAHHVSAVSALITEADQLSADAVMNDPHDALGIVRRLVRALGVQFDLKERYHTKSMDFFDEVGKLGSEVSARNAMIGRMREYLDQIDPSNLDESPAWPTILRRIFSTAPADMRAQRDAEVWDEGFDAGCDDLGAAAVAQEHGEDENPYRAGAE